MRTYKLYASIAATTDIAASVLFQRAARIKSVRWEVDIDQVADNSKVELELSTRATNQLATSDTVGDISALRCHANLVTSGLALGRAGKQEMLDYPIGVGERVYLHAAITTSTVRVTIYLDVID